MKNIVTFLVLCIATLVSARTLSAGEYDYLKPKDNEVVIHYSGIEVPLGRMLLIRKDSHYCAVKFTRSWTEKGGREEEKYATYEVYYQGDGTGDFSNKNMMMTKGMASALPLKGPFHPFNYQPGDSYVKCGPFRLTWGYKTGVFFMPADKGMGDFGFQLSPTPWGDIKEVNVNDSRVKWYRYDPRRKRLFIPIDNLWREMHKDRSNEVLIANDGVEVPLARVLLIRKGSQYCAVRFKKYWTENEGKKVYANYESYYPGEGSSDFSNSSVEVTEDTIYLLSPQKLSDPIKRPENEQIKCGPIKLFWDGNGFVSFYYDRWDYDYPNRRNPIELAPTPWVDISLVNVYDQRVKWYKSDFKRRNIFVSIDKLWEDRK